jgi:hypothetical protein
MNKEQIRVLRALVAICPPPWKVVYGGWKQKIGVVDAHNKSILIGEEALSCLVALINEFDGIEHLVEVGRSVLGEISVCDTLHHQLDAAIAVVRPPCQRCAGKGKIFMTADMTHPDLPDGIYDCPECTNAQAVSSLLR